MTESEFRKRDILKSISSNYDAVDADALLVSASYGDITITLPHPDLAARVYVKKVDATANVVIIVPQDPDTEPIDSAASLTVHHQNEGYSLICDGDSWSILGRVSGDSLLLEPDS